MSNEKEEGMEKRAVVNTEQEKQAAAKANRDAAALTKPAEAKKEKK